MAALESETAPKIASAMLLGGLFFAPAALAKAPAEETAADVASGEIFVSARKRSESLQDVPAAISANFGLGYVRNYAPQRTWGLRLSRSF